MEVVNKSQIFVPVSLCVALLSSLDEEAAAESLRFVIEQKLRKEFRIAYLAAEPDADRVYYQKAKAFYHGLGFQLGSYFELSECTIAMIESLFDHDAIHISGGNTFVLLESILKTNATQKLRHFLESGKPIIGVSAGAMILGPSVETAYLCGDKNKNSLEDLTAVNRFPLPIVVHCEDGKPKVTDERALYLSDNDALVALDGKLYTCGFPIIQ